MIGQHVASRLLEQHAVLFWQAKLGNLDAKRYIGANGQLYSVGQALRGVEGELRRRGEDIVLACEPACIDLVNILVQRGEWEGE